VKRGASIGANATIICGVTLGEYCFIGAGAVIHRDVPAYALMVGVPARRAGWMCQCGERLRLEDGRAECAACGARYAEAEGALRQIAPPKPRG
jgi:UDP-2-acetamido-3-amino-2,3-dideoxy-glucuronate N-acetyltransferase